MSCILSLVGSSCSAQEGEEILCILGEGGSLAGNSVKTHVNFFQRRNLDISQIALPETGLYAVAKEKPYQNYLQRQFEALQKGMGDGATLGTPWWIYAVKEGYKNMGSGNEFGPGLPTSGITVAAEKIAKYPEQVRGFVRAYVKTMKYCRENIDGTLDIMMKYCGEWGVDSREIAKMVYDIKGPYWSVDVDVDGVAKLLDLTSKKFGKPLLSVEDFLDLRFLTEAKRDLG